MKSVSYKKVKMAVKNIRESKPEGLGKVGAQRRKAGFTKK
jgi:hypothetical protein